MNWPAKIDKIQAAVNERFAANDWWHYRDETVRRFEEKFAEYHGRRFGVAVCNGTVPLEIILRAFGIGKDDKVLVPAFDFYSLPKSIANTGAIPVFCDVKKDNLTIDAELVRDRIKKGDIRAVVGVHISSSVPELDVLTKICSNAGVHFIEDCAQSAGAVYDNRKAGSWGTASYFSFGGVKLMTSGHGGMILTDDEELYHKCYTIVNRGSLPDGKLNPFGIIGEKFGMPQLCAAALLPQLEMLDELCAQREDMMRMLDEKIKDIPGVRLVKQFEKTSIRAQMRYCFFYDSPQQGLSRSQLVVKLREAGIPITDLAHKSVPNDERLFNVFGKGQDFPAARKVETSLMSTYHWELLRGKEFWSQSVDKLKKILGKATKA
jgi:dTDP-4-amino-4,6-dideoxygalactose transaminase